MEYKMVNCECEVDPRIGRRVAVGKYHGIVRYVGLVPPTQGIWLGIEWDDPTRGKHDGMHNGVRYFYTSHPTSGSFVRIEKADFGCSCVSAIKERYASNQLTLTAEELQDLQRAMNAPQVEMVGFEQINQKQSCFSSLEVVCLHNQQISHVGDGLATMCPNTQSLDLSSNLLISWIEVADVTVNFPLLQLLNLSDNRLYIPEKLEQLHHAFKNLSHMVMAHMAYTWDQICDCSKMWPQIQMLQVPFNNIRSINLPENVLVNLTYLDLEGNNISQWEEINKLGTLDKLESLNLCDLGLTNICLPTPQNLFKSLQCLLISNNKIEKWEYISELDKLQKLQELRFNNNPVLDNLNVETIYYKTIARIGSLKILNRNYIRREERRGAEMDYLKEHGREWLEALKNEDIKLNFLSKHPRFPSLIKKHGAADEYELRVQSTALHSSLVQLKLSSPDKSFTKSLPKTMAVSRLISLVQRLFNICGTMPALSYHSLKHPDIEIEIDSHLKTLDFYSVEDGDEIFVRW